MVSLSSGEQEGLRLAVLRDRFRFVSVTKSFDRLKRGPCSLL